ncbi:MAG: LysM peptidoglycan-binding domain-containing protein, partial [Candidatus Levyibacteriota bacterium]
KSRNNLNRGQTGSTSTVANEQATQKMPKTYTVKSGDYLWSIAIRAYGDGYQWVKIAKANNLTNPDLIFSGNVLQLPR